MSHTAQMLIDLIQRIKVNRFSFLLEAKDNLRLPPYKGSTLRGAFGWAFKSICCCQPQSDCSDCLVSEPCVYSYVFETAPPPQSEIMKLYPTVPHPFVIEPPMSRQQIFPSGSRFELGMVLIGRAREYLPYFVLAFREMGDIGLGAGRGKYELVRVKSEDGAASQEIFERSFSKIHGCPLPADLRPSDIPDGVEELRVAFHTPTRIIFQEQLTAHPEFHILMRTLLRRISALAYFHCGTTLDLDFKALVEYSRQVETVREDIHWLDWERYSNRQKTKMKMGGFVGSATYRGPWKEFWPLIRLGELTHIGKGTTFGLGRYSLQTA